MKPCRNSHHTWKEILRYPKCGFDEVVRWCEYCGSVTVDVEADNRIYIGRVLKIQNPQIMKDLVESERSEL